jgi:hypothetical protein
MTNERAKNLRVHHLLDEPLVRPAVFHPEKLFGGLMLSRDTVSEIHAVAGNGASAKQLLKQKSEANDVVRLAG